MDLTVKLADYIYVIEIKVQRPATGGATPSAATIPELAQIRARDNSAKYCSLPGRGLFDLGLVFDSRDRKLSQADWRAMS